MKDERCDWCEYQDEAGICMKDKWVGWESPVCDKEGWQSIDITSSTDVKVCAAS